MIPNDVIRRIERKCNAVACSECGQLHHVALLSERDVVMPRFSQGSCEGFKEQVNSLIKTELSRFMNDPLPLLR